MSNDNTEYRHLIMADPHIGLNAKVTLLHLVANLHPTGQEAIGACTSFEAILDYLATFAFTFIRDKEMQAWLEALRKWHMMARYMPPVPEPPKVELPVAEVAALVAKARAEAARHKADFPAGGIIMAGDGLSGLQSRGEEINIPNQHPMPEHLVRLLNGEVE
jgi:hypothetical protein